MICRTKYFFKIMVVEKQTKQSQSDNNMLESKYFLKVELTIELCTPTKIFIIVP